VIEIHIAHIGSRKFLALEFLRYSQYISRISRRAKCERHILTSACGPELGELRLFRSADLGLVIMFRFYNIQGQNQNFLSYNAALVLIESRISKSSENFCTCDSRLVSGGSGSLAPAAVALVFLMGSCIHDQ
jgi:hypothetical protein